MSQRDPISPCPSCLPGLQTIDDATEAGKETTETGPHGLGVVEAVIEQKDGDAPAAPVVHPAEVIENDVPALV